jgi:pimeloyl-ACP methyl ester carboxylesterase
VKAVFSIAALFLLMLSYTVVRATEVVRLVDVSHANCSAPCQRSAVVFIHGILGSHETWQNGAINWPSLLAGDPEIGDKVDVYRVDFDSYLFTAGPSIIDVTQGLERHLDGLFRAKKHSKIFLIGHSLGGNIARAYLMHIKLKYGHRLLSSFKVTYTLGTPMEGSSLATLAVFASQNQHLRVLLPIKVNDFQQMLNKNSVDIVNKRTALDRHGGYCPAISVLSAYEMQPMAIVGTVVSAESATKYSDDAKGFAKNHSTLAKPRDRSDAVYKWVTDSMRECIAGRGVCEERMTEACVKPAEDWSEAEPRLAPASSERMAPPPAPR